MKQLLLGTFVLCLLTIPMNPAHACVIRQAKLVDVVDDADALVIARVLSVSKKTSKGRIPSTNVDVRVSIEEVLAGTWEPGESQLRHVRHKAHKRGKMTVCPLLSGSGLELKLKRNRRYLMLLGNGPLDAAQLIRVEPLANRAKLQKAFEQVATRVRIVKPTVWVWDMCNNRLIEGDQPPIDCLTTQKITTVEPNHNKAETSIHSGRFARYSTDSPIEKIHYKGRTIQVFWSKGSNKTQEVYIEGKREGGGRVVIQPESGTPIEIQVEVKPPLMGF